MERSRVKMWKLVYTSSMFACIVFLKMEVIIITLGKEGENNSMQYVIKISPDIQCTTSYY